MTERRPPRKDGKLERLGEVMARPEFYGIPTMYRGIETRSRLEARWLAFFDQCGWEWQYEPFDLPGWIPDVMLGGKVLVEIKPFTTLEEFEGEIKTIGRALNAAKLNREVLLLGTQPQDVDADTWDELKFGWFAETQPYDHGNDWSIPLELWVEPAIIGWAANRVDFCHAYGSYQCRMTGWYEGHTPSMHSTELRTFWTNACNETKWKPEPHGRIGD